MVNSMTGEHQQLVLITGYSGAGKSSAVRIFEDHDYFCVDNLPPGMVTALADMAAATDGLQRAAVVCDGRSGQMLRELTGACAELAEKGQQPFVIFLHASQQTLINRFKETRRRHPLAGDGTAAEGIAAEAEMLEDLRSQADLVIDTTDLAAAQLTKLLCDEMLRGHAIKPTLTVRSFGYKHGPPNDADLCFDVRFLPNPYYDPELRPLTGVDPRVAEYAARDGIMDQFYEHLLPMTDFLIPQYLAEGKAHIVIAIGCTGGRHRSVAVAERLAEYLMPRDDVAVVISHRDIDKANHQYVSSAGK
jgi:UPF0042 nucleotide-binding protein